MPETIPESCAPAGAILVADDDPMLRLMAERLLETHGFKVVLAEDGADAVRRFAESPADYAAVLLDVSMPKLGGDAATTAIHRIRPDIPVILTSGRTEAMLEKRLELAHAEAFLPKPFSLYDLLDAISVLTHR